jgi:hypothetical protein
VEILWQNVVSDNNIGSPYQMKLKLFVAKTNKSKTESFVSVEWNCEPEAKLIADFQR